MDEDHPTVSWNAYETSKLAGEAAAERIALRHSRYIDLTLLDPVPRPVSGLCHP